MHNEIHIVLGVRIQALRENSLTLVILIARRRLAVLSVGPKTVKYMDSLILIVARRFRTFVDQTPIIHKRIRRTRTHIFINN